MKYFVMEEDNTLTHAVVIEEFPTDESVDYDKSIAHDMQDMTILHTIEDEHTIYPYFRSAPMNMVQEAVAEVIQLYEETVVWKGVALHHRESNHLVRYQLVLLDRIDCLHPTTEFEKDGSLKRLVVDEKKIGDRQIFQVKGIVPNFILVSLPIAESILRREPCGIRFREVECVRG